MPKSPKQDRYTIGALAKGLKVLEALEGRSFEAVSLDRVTSRAGLPKSYCFRALRTLAAAGYAKQTVDGDWQLTGRLARFSDQVFDAIGGDPDSDNRNPKPH